MLRKELERELSSHSTKLRDRLLVLTFLVTVSVSTETVPEVDPLERPAEDCLGFVFFCGGCSVSPIVEDILAK
jgi:hypothetical protein